MLKISDVEPVTALNGKFTDGSVAGGISPTRLVAAFFNAVQTELVNVVEMSGMQLDKDDSTQVLKALHKLFLQRANPLGDIKADGAAAVATALANLGFGGGTNWTKLPDGTIIQRGSVSGFTEYTVTLPVPYTNKDNFVVTATCNGVIELGDGARTFVEAINTGPGTFTLVCINAAGVRSPRAVSWIAQGKI